MIIIACICLLAFLRLVQTQQQIGGSYGDMGGILVRDRRDLKLHY